MEKRLTFTIAIIALSSGFVASDFIRTVNAVLAPHIREDLGVTEAILGYVTASFYVAFILIQIPIGSALDKIGPKMVQLYALPVAVIGATFCGFASGPTTFGIGRCLLGVGLASALMASLKGVALWYPKGQIPKINGFVLACGALGGVIATWPANVLAEFSGWRSVYLTASGICVFAWCAALVFVPSPEPESGPAIRSNFGIAFRNRELKLVLWSAASAVGTASAFQGLWAGLWIFDVGQIDQGQMSFVLLILSMMTVVGSFAIGYVASELLRRGVCVTSTLLAGIFIFTVLQTTLIFFPSSPIVWGLYAFFGTTGMLGFAIISIQLDPKTVGSANAVFNIMCFGMALLVQIVFGLMIDLVRHVARTDMVGAYVGALLLLIAAQMTVLTAAFVAKRAS